MELGQYHVQIFVSLAVILGAAFVALICDLLKRNNEQLRELALELKVRREEEHKRFQILAPRLLAEATAGAPAEALPQAPQPVAQKVKAPQEQAVETSERKPRRQRDPNRPALAPEALAAIQRGIELAATPQSRRPPAPIPEVMPQQEPAAAKAVEPVEQAACAEVVEPVVEILQPVANSPSTTRTRDWGQLLSVRRPPAPPAKKRSRRAEGPVPAELALPAGFQDGFVLSRLVESRQPVSGLVVSIGASALQNQDAAISAKVRTLIQSLLGTGDFAVQSGSDEFLLIYPGERGAEAQRKLKEIAEQLWDFQLRSMGALSIQFSWGGVEVRSESIDEAIASATERMQETRRNRKILTMEPRGESEAPLRKAV